MRTRNPNQKLSAIAWKARQNHMSYGDFAATLTELAREKIYREFDLMLAQQQAEEQSRLKRSVI